MPPGNEGVMFVGIDVFHEKMKNSMAAMVGTLSPAASSFKTQLSVQRQGQENSSNEFRSFMDELLRDWFQVSEPRLVSKYFEFLVTNCCFFL